ncbi:hypothetical protein BDR06DRAFT_977891 [Suillus hirtellus]|nr:hypothetical protein BDR06DRAFT_977891 [Suillus hirtellus]
MQPLNQSVTDIVSDSEGTQVVDEGSAGPVDISHYDYYEELQGMLLTHDNVWVQTQVWQAFLDQCLTTQLVLLLTLISNFEFASLTHKAALNKEQTDELLQLIQNIVDGHVRLTFRSHNDVSKAWDTAATQLTPFEQHTISVDNKQDKLEFEPWTADRWWHIQLKLPNDGVPFAIILYANKTHLFSSGIVKGYPVITYCRNLPVNIRNTTGMGGGQVVGWLPIVHDGTDMLYQEDYVTGEEALEEKSLQPIENSFWQVWHSNPHEIISQDLLHAFHGGLFGKHLWTKVKKLLENLGYSALKQVDDQFTAFPWWQNLNHFNSITNISYTQNVLTWEEDKAGYALLKYIASYLHIDMYISLNVHTESTIATGEVKVLPFKKHMMDYIITACHTKLGTKSWNFSKMHSLKHIFQDISEKGAARNFST